MDIEKKRPEYHPTIGLNAEGQPYIRVYTRRGYRTRHTTAGGWEWLRTKYPATAFPSVSEIPITYDDYRVMLENEFITTHAKQRATAKLRSSPIRMPGAERPLIGWSGEGLEQLFTDCNGDETILGALAKELQHRTRPRMMVLRARVGAALTGGPSQPRERDRPSPRVTHKPDPIPQPTNQPPSSARTYCENCGTEQRTAAKFCPACGCLGGIHPAYRNPPSNSASTNFPSTTERHRPRPETLWKWVALVAFGIAAISLLALLL